MTGSASGRHLTKTALLQHWDDGVPVAIPLTGNPSLGFRIEPARERLTLRAPISAQVEPPFNRLAHLAIEVRLDEGARWLEISTTDKRLVVDGYAMLMAVADRIQLDGADPLAALEQTLATWQSILATRTRMSPQAEIGLLGELLVVRALLATTVAGIGAWRGALGEEHDFGFHDADVEVKTTSREQRHHWIHGLDQLVPTGDTPLWLMSLRVTRAGEGEGQRLPDLIDQLRAATAGADREYLDTSIAAAGWTEDQRDLVTDLWRLRTAPAGFQVAGDFPRLTPAQLKTASIDLAPLREVTYQIDLEGREPSDHPPSTVATIINHMGDRFGG